MGDFIASRLGERQFGEVLRESLLIGGWVAMWRPMEIFLYDWWPIRAEARLFDRVSAMLVRIAYTRDATSDASRWDWPVVDGAQRPRVLVKPSSNWRFGGARSFGSPGSGGSLGFADPTAGIGYAYVTSLMGTRLIGDPRDVALREALYSALQFSTSSQAPLTGE